MGQVMHRPIYIFDLDGTLANGDHRLHFITGEAKNWAAYFAACGGDEPIKPTIRLLSMLHASGADVWVWTGRSDEVRHETRIWLRNNMPVHLGWAYWTEANLRMRQAGDHRHDDVLKREWLHSLNDYQRGRVAGVFEDRSRVVEMWRAEGLTCYQVAKGDF